MDRSEKRALFAPALPGYQAGLPGELVNIKGVGQTVAFPERVLKILTHLLFSPSCAILIKD
jgi:hypothetical protein